MATERTVAFKGEQTPLAGDAIHIGDKAPNFEVVDRGLNVKTLEDWAGKIRVISVVPSLDTPVCDAQTRRFNEEVSRFGDKVVVLTVSMDLPFAQNRWCGAAGLEGIVTLSDFRQASFGQNWGTLMQEWRLESRAVFVVDTEDVVRYVEYVPEIGKHPDYAAALRAVEALIS